MPQVTSCPDAQAFQRVLGGHVGAADAERLAEHLELCGRCADTVEQLLASDTLREALQRGGEAQGDDPVVVRLMEKLRGLRQGSAAPAQADKDDEYNLDFLAPAQADDEIGRLGPYRVFKVLGIGGMGIVFEAEDVDLRRRVALKVMLPNSAAKENARQRFLREARAAAAIKHDHIVTIYQVGQDRGVPYLAMEFLQGEPLDQWLGRGRTPTVAQALRLAREIACGLAAAHEHNLIHRDIKPENIWLEVPTGRVKILDFGLALQDGDQRLTQSGMIVGTPAYMAPEQARDSSVDQRSDLFSLGCLLYRLCTGELPFKGSNALSTLTSLALDTPAPVRSLNPAIPEAFSSLITRLLAKDPKERPTSAKEVVQALQVIEREISPVAAVVASSLAIMGAPMEAHQATVASGVISAVSPDPKNEVRTVRIGPDVRRPAFLKRPRVRRAVVATVFLLAGMILAAAFSVFRVQPPTGDFDFVLEIDDPDVAVQVNQKGLVVVHDRKVNREFTLVTGKYVLPAGTYEVVVTDEKAGLTFNTKTFTIQRGDTVVLKAWVEAKAAAKPADDAWIAEVAKLPADKQVEAVTAKLKERNPRFDGRVTPRIDDGVVTKIQFLTDAVTDISPVRALTGLKILDCGASVGSGILVDLKPLQGMALNDLSLPWNPQLADLSPLRGMPLASLHLGGCSNVKSLAPLKGMPLKFLHLWATSVADLSPLAGMQLEGFNAGGVPIADLSPLKGMPLTYYEAVNTKVTDYTPLTGMPLRRIHADFILERDSEVLRSLKSLEHANQKPVAEFLKKVP